MGQHQAARLQRPSHAQLLLSDSHYPARHLSPSEISAVRLASSGISYPGQSMKEVGIG